MQEWHNPGKIWMISSLFIKPKKKQIRDAKQCCDITMQSCTCYLWFWQSTNLWHNSLVSHLFEDKLTSTSQVTIFARSNDSYNCPLTHRFQRPHLGWGEDGALSTQIWKALKAKSFICGSFNIWTGSLDTKLVMVGWQYRTDFSFQKWAQLIHFKDPWSKIWPFVKSEKKLLHPSPPPQWCEFRFKVGGGKAIFGGSGGLPHGNIFQKKKKNDANDFFSDKLPFGKKVGGGPPPPTELTSLPQ